MRHRLLVLAPVVGLAACAQEPPIAAQPVMLAPGIQVPIVQAPRIEPARAPTVSYIMVHAPARMRQAMYFPVYVGQVVIPTVRVPTEMPARTFTIFFRTGSHEIDASAAQTIREAAALLREGHGIRLSLYGHADRVGSEDMNQELSQRRVLAVRNMMVSLGVPAEAITLHAHGERNNAVPTADGVPSQANRRVEAVIE
jgi:outer membrane protein OmpA-like peptidoglycan-associated protein